MSIEKFLENVRVNGKAQNTFKTYNASLKMADKWKPLAKWKKEDVNQYILYMQRKYKPGTVEIKKGALKQYFTWAGKTNFVSHLKIKLPKNDLKREDLLTVEDVNLMIENIESPMYKALIAFLFESGARINEALSVKIKDLQETDKGLIISIYDTKNDQYRRGLYIYSVGYIRNHIAYSGLGKDDRLFKINSSWVWKILKKIAKKAGITKPVSPHKFRHAQATDMMRRGYQESIIRKKLGWTADSEMIARYQKAIDDDVIEATAAQNGQETSRQVITTLKQAEPLKLANAALQLKQLAEENEELRAKIADFEEFKKKIESSGLWSKMDKIEREK